MELIGENLLLDAAVEAARSLPVAWTRSPGALDGVYAGRHGVYGISVSSPRPDLLVVRAAIGDPPSRERREQTRVLCLAANRRYPTAGFQLAPGENGGVHAVAVLGPDLGCDLPDPAVIRNTLRRCVLNAELIAPMLRRAHEGAVVFGGNYALLDLCAELDDVPECLRAEGPSPAPDAALIDACEAAASAAGWSTWRRTPRQLMVDSGLSPEDDPLVTFIDADEGTLIASAYAFGPDRNVPSSRRADVAELLHRLLDPGAPYSLALDLESGAVAAHGFFDLAGAEGLPSDSLICGLIEQAAQGAASSLGPIMRVAHEGASAQVALAEDDPAFERRAS